MKTRYKEIFIFISGSTPQVITESIYALAMQKPPVHPQEIYVITTCKGKALAEEALNGKGILKNSTFRRRLLKRVPLLFRLIVQVISLTT